MANDLAPLSRGPTRLVNGRDGRAAFRTREFRLVLLDIMLPDTTGIELLSEIKAFDGMIQVIMMTGTSRMTNVIQCLESGANEYLLKPFENTDDVRNAVRDSIRKLRKWEAALRGEKPADL